MTFIFNVFNQCSKKSYAKYGKCTHLQTYFSEKNMWHSIARNGFSKNLRKQFCLKKCDRVWLFDCNLLSEQSNLSYIKRRYDFQANILKEIHNNHYELQEYNKHALSISTATFCYQLGETNFSLFRKISTNAFVGFGNRCFFKNMLFRGCFIRIGLDSCFRVFYFHIWQWKS